MLNTFIGHRMEHVNSRNPKNSREEPSSVLLYNSKMGGVDEVDKMMKPYQNHKKILKWYKKIYFHMLDLAAYNSFVLYKQKKQ